MTNLCRELIVLIVLIILFIYNYKKILIFYMLSVGYKEVGAWNGVQGVGGSNPLAPTNFGDLSGLSLPRIRFFLCRWAN